MSDVEICAHSSRLDHRSMDVNWHCVLSFLPPPPHPLRLFHCFLLLFSSLSFRQFRSLSFSFFSPPPVFTSLSLSVHVYVYFTYQIRTERRPKSVRFYVSVHCGHTCIHIGVYIALGFHALRVIAYTPTHPATFTHSHAFHIYILTHPPLHTHKHIPPPTLPPHTQTHNTCVY